MSECTIIHINKYGNRYGKFSLHHQNDSNLLNKIIYIRVKSTPFFKHYLKRDYDAELV